jgi:magnesium-transporting ATPase (P-type)
VRAEINAKIESMAKTGLRTICIAYRDALPSAWSEKVDGEWALSEEELECELICVGVVGIKDPIRPEVVGAVAKCQSAGNARSRARTHL